MKILIEVSDECAHILSAQAALDGLDRKTYIQTILERQATKPLVKSRYAIHFSTVDGSGAQGQIRRFTDVASLSCVGLTEEQSRIAEEAKRLIQRNQSGDKEESVRILKAIFPNVYEMSV